MSGGLYRVGRKLGRTIYRGDKLIGMMDTPTDAALVMKALNDEQQRLEAKRRRCQCGCEAIPICPRCGHASC